MGRSLFLTIGLLMALLLVACSSTASTSTAAQPESVSPEITVYKSPT